MGSTSTSSAFQKAGDDLRISGYDPLIPPNILQMEHPLSDKSEDTVASGRKQTSRILRRHDDRLIVVVGPCSIHDTQAALEYCDRLKEYAKRASDDLCIVMRVYFEKPRTTVGWKGLINDPDLNDTFNINKGLHMARSLLCSITERGMPAGCELLDTISPQFLGDLFSWGAIGARTTESQLHRELASGVSFPVGFKNGTDGNATIAIDAIRSAGHGHHFLGVTKSGLAAITKTTGNPLCHIILRGGNSGPNYDSEWVGRISEQITKAGVVDNIMVDCSHGNSRKDHRNQPAVCADVARQVAAGNRAIVGVMIESNILEGRQDIPSEAEGGIGALKHGQSITDACVSWEQTVPMLDELAAAVRQRRELNRQA